MRKLTVSGKVTIVSVVCGLLLAAGVAAQNVQLATMGFKSVAAQSYVPDEVIVKFKPNVAAQFRAQAIAAYGDRQLSELTPNGYVHVKLKPGTDVTQGMALFNTDANIESVQPNYIYRPLAAPNDANYSQMWGLKNTGQTITAPSYAINNPGLAGQDMDMEAAWDRITDCRSIIVAVLDSGVNYTHQDLRANMWDGVAAGFPNHGFDFVDNDNDPMPRDANGHGTHVAGTIGAVGNNGIGMTGVCWQAKIMAVRVTSETSGTTATIVQGVNFAVARGAKVINMSLGGPNFDAAFDAEITNAKNNKVIVVVAAGNENDNNDGGAPTAGQTRFPCNFSQDNVICVAALDQVYNLATFSNYGTTSVDVGAPGANAMSTWPGPIIRDDFTTWSGTVGFAQGICDPDGPGSRAAQPMLVTPPSWCTAGGYLNNASDFAFKTFDLSGSMHARLKFLYYLDTEFNFDFFAVALRDGPPPFSPPGVVVGTDSGTSNNLPRKGSIDLNNCLLTTCSMGFGLATDSSNTARGVGVLDFQIHTVQANTNAYNVIDGTSMASPHVAGLAALIWAYSPAYTYSDVVSAIKNGGEQVPALVGRTTTGRAVNAMGSLRFISPPAGIAASLR